MKATPALITMLTVLAAASAVHAQVAPRADLMTAHLARPAALQSKLDGGALNMTRPGAAFDVAYDRAGPPRIPGVARTSVDHKLASDDLTGSLGFLCGLEPGAGKDGGAAARGYDPSGRFVGAKLSLAFR